MLRMTRINERAAHIAVEAMMLLRDLEDICPTWREQIDDEDSPSFLKLCEASCELKTLASKVEVLSTKAGAEHRNSKMPGGRGGR